MADNREWVGAGPSALARGSPRAYIIPMISVVGIVYNARSSDAKDMAAKIAGLVGNGRQSWMKSAGELGEEGASLIGTDLIITVGGDGTILRAAKAAVAHGIPLLGVNMGRLGFMTELRPADALERIPSFLEGGGWIEERSMLKTQVVGESEWHHALNDVVVTRGATPRLIWVQAMVDGAELTSYRADAVIVSSATGSTGYNLSSGGPILDPRAQEMVLKPVAPHVGLATAVVLPPSASIDLSIESYDGALLSVDGYLNEPVAQGSTVRIEGSERKAKFLRERSSREFYASLTRRLGFWGGMGAGRAVYY